MWKTSTPRENQYSKLGDPDKTERARKVMCDYLDHLSLPEHIKETRERVLRDNLNFFQQRKTGKYKCSVKTLKAATNNVFKHRQYKASAGGAYVQGDGWQASLREDGMFDLIDHQLGKSVVELAELV